MLIGRTQKPWRVFEEPNETGGAPIDPPPVVRPLTAEEINALVDSRANAIADERDQRRQAQEAENARIKQEQESRASGDGFDDLLDDTGLVDSSKVASALRKIQTAHKEELEKVRNEAPTIAIKEVSRRATAEAQGRTAIDSSDLPDAIKMEVRAAFLNMTTQEQENSIKDGGLQTAIESRLFRLAKEGKYDINKPRPQIPSAAPVYGYNRPVGTRDDLTQEDLAKIEGLEKQMGMKFSDSDLASVLSGGY